MNDIDIDVAFKAWWDAQPGIPSAKLLLEDALRFAWYAATEAAQARIRELEAALKPFAAIAVRDDPAPHDDTLWMATWCVIDTFPTVGDVRCAAALLAPKPAR